MALLDTPNNPVKINGILSSNLYDGVYNVKCGMRHIRWISGVTILHHKKFWACERGYTQPSTTYIIGRMFRVTLAWQIL
jgi:hypothetical protein